MCNLYRITKGQRAFIEFTRAMRDTTGNLPPLPGIFPDYMAPIVRNAPDSVRELMMARWGLPSSQLALVRAAKKRADRLKAKRTPYDFEELLRMEPDSGTTNIRNVAASTGSDGWGRPTDVWCHSHHSAVQQGGRRQRLVCFRRNVTLAVFAGIWTRWTSVRKVKEGEPPTT